VQIEMTREWVWFYTTKKSEALLAIAPNAKTAGVAAKANAPRPALRADILDTANSSGDINKQQ
jgi:hypothetical protein